VQGDLAHQLEMNRVTWAELQKNGVTEETELRLDFSFVAPGQHQAEALAQAIGDALRKPQAGETRVRAALTRIECGPKGLVFVLKAGERTLRLTAAGFDGLHLVNFSQGADGQLTCGARKAETPSVVTYRPSTDARAKTDGALVALEFVPASFQLKQ